MPTFFANIMSKNFNMFKRAIKKKLKLQHVQGSDVKSIKLTGKRTIDKLRLQLRLAFKFSNLYKFVKEKLILVELLGRQKQIQWILTK